MYRINFVLGLTVYTFKYLVSFPTSILLSVSYSMLPISSIENHKWNYSLLTYRFLGLYIIAVWVLIPFTHNDNNNHNNMNNNNLFIQ